MIVSVETLIHKDVATISSKARGNCEACKEVARGRLRKRNP